MNDGRVVVVTGGASGMGAACARRFHELGDTVVILDRDSDRAVGLATELGLPDPFVGDVGSSGFCETVAATVVERHGRIDVLVNAAGTMHRGDAENTPDADWRRVMSANVDGVFFMCRAVLPAMIERGAGAIVNFGSISGTVASTGSVVYCASKGAVHQLTRALALDHVEHGIRVNAVAPGEVDTPMLVSHRPQPMTAADLQKLADETIPMKRLAQPDEIARVVVFLASEDASYMTGAIVPVDAGFTAR